MYLFQYISLQNWHFMHYNHGSKRGFVVFSSKAFSSVTQSYPTLWDPMDCSMPGFPVHHQLWSLLKLMSTGSVMPSNHLILCCPLLLPSIFPSIRVFSNQSQLFASGGQSIKSFSFSISPSNEYSGLISFRMGWLDFLAVQRTLTSLLTTVQKHHFFGAQLSLWSNSHVHT